MNQVTPLLFAQFPTPAAMALAPPPVLEELIHSTGFFRNKAKNLIGASRAIVERHGGQVPHTMAELCELPGVARKTANVVLGTAFGLAEGIVVDTHVQRLAQRLALTRSSTPEKIEQDLMTIIPREWWIQFSHHVFGTAAAAASPAGRIASTVPSYPTAPALSRRDSRNRSAPSSLRCSMSHLLAHAHEKAVSDKAVDAIHARYLPALQSVHDWLLGRMAE